MKIKDKTLKLFVDVANADCASRSCYWPRSDPGVFTQGQGYRSRGYDAGWLCGTREAHGCPSAVKPVEWHDDKDERSPSGTATVDGDLTTYGSPLRPGK